MCFELLGYDIFIDEKGKPILLEINHLPSLNSDTEIDREVKDPLLYDTFNLLNLSKLNKCKKKAEIWKEARDWLIYAKCQNVYNEFKIEALK